MGRDVSYHDFGIGNLVGSSFVVSGMGTIALTADKFDQTVTSNDIVVVDFWADWCGPCKAFAPTFEKASETHEDVVFAKVDTEAEQSLAAAANIRSIPTLMVFKKGNLVYNEAGALPPAALEDLISQAKALEIEPADISGSTDD